MSPTDSGQILDNAPQDLDPTVGKIKALGRVPGWIDDPPRFRDADDMRRGRLLPAPPSHAPGPPVAVDRTCTHAHPNSVIARNG